MKDTQLLNVDAENIFFLRSKSADCKIEIHLHDSYEIFMALSSNIRYHIEGNAYDLNAGDVVITNEKEIHRPATYKNGEYERQFIQFKPSIFSRFFNDSYNPLRIFEERSLGQNNKISFSDSNSTNPAKEIFEEISQLSNVKSAKNYLIIKTLLIRLLTEIEGRYKISTAVKKNAGEPDSRIEAVILDLNQNFDKPFSLEETSKSHFMDKYYLCHLFKKVTGFSLMEYVQSKRIQNAKMLISQGTGIMEAAQLSGFDEYSNFYKTFSKLVKMPPKKYKDYIVKAGNLSQS